MEFQAISQQFTSWLKFHWLSSTVFFSLRITPPSQSNPFSSILIYTKSHPLNQPSFDTTVTSQIILPSILSIQNSNCTQKYKYLRRKPFLLKGKKALEKLQISFTIIKSIYNISCVCLTAKEKFLLFFFALTYTLLVCLTKAITFCSLLLSYLLKVDNPLLSLP